MTFRPEKNLRISDVMVLSDIDRNALLATGGVTNEPTGFQETSTSTLSFTARVFTINPTGTSFEYWIKGMKYSVTSSDVANINTVTIPDTAGTHVIYYDAGVLSQILNPTHSQLDVILIDMAIVGIIYWNASDAAAYILADERHGIIMDGKTHEWIHDVVGASYREGFAAGDYVEDTDTDAALTFEVEDGIFYDEDIEVEIENGTPATKYEQQLNGGDAEIPILYRDDIDGSWTEDAATTLPYKSLGAGRLAYNNDDGDGTFSQIEVTDNRWVSMTLIATNDWQYPIKAIQGQAEYTTVQTAIEEATTEILNFGDFPSAETIILYRFVMRTKSTFGGTKKAIIDDVTDFRASRVSGANANIVSHGALAGLSDDDHSQYALLAGRLGDTLNIDNIGEFTGAAGVTIDNNLNVPSSITSPVFRSDSNIAYETTGNMNFIIDSDDNETGRAFSWTHNHLAGDDVPLGSLLASLTDSGDFFTKGDLNIDGGNLGITLDLDLILMEVDALTINGTLTSTGNATVPNLLIDTNGFIGPVSDSNLLDLDTNRLIINGNVGIGGITPTAPLDVGGASGGKVRISRIDAEVLDGNTIGTVDFYSQDTQSLGDPIAANIACFAVGDQVGANPNARLKFQTSTAASGLADALIIDADQNVTISEVLLADTIGIAADKDLLELASGALTVNGDLTAGVITISGSEITGSGGSVDFGSDLVFTQGQMLCANLVAAQIGPFADTNLLILSTNILTINGDLRVQGGDIGTSSDPNLLGLATESFTVRGVTTSTLKIRAQTSIHIKERSGNETPVAGYGQLWVKNNAPAELWYTDDAGGDTQLA